MPKTCLLIDLQNQRPKPEHVTQWIGQDGEVWIFFGEHEISRLHEYLAIGDQVSIVPVSRVGKNSLDFLLVLYLGYLVAKRPIRTRFVIVAADMGYDSAVDRARAEGFDVLRVEDLATELPAKESAAVVAAPAAPEEAAKTVPPAKERKIDKIRAGILKDVTAVNRPHDLEALQRHIQSRFGSEPLPDEVDKVIAWLETRDAIKVVDSELIYVAAPRKT